MNIRDFELSKEDMDNIAKMDMGHIEIIDCFSSETAKRLNTMKIHD